MGTEETLDSGFEDTSLAEVKQTALDKKVDTTMAQTLENAPNDELEAKKNQTEQTLGKNLNEDSLDKAEDEGNEDKTKNMKTDELLFLNNAVQSETELQSKD